MSILDEGRRPEVIPCSKNGRQIEAHMKIEEIKELIESVAHHGITELDIDSSGMKLNDSQGFAARLRW